MTSRPPATPDDLRRIATWGDPGKVPDPADLAARAPRRGAGRAPSASGSRWVRAAAAALVVAAVAAAVVVATGPGDSIPATGGTWRPMAAGPLAARVHPAAVWTGDEVLVFGGTDVDGRPFLDGAAYDPAADTWRSLAPYPRSSAGLWAGGLATWTGSELLVFMRGAGTTRWDWDLAAYDPAADTWRTLLEGRFTQHADDTLEALAPVPVKQPEAAAWIAGELVIVGWDSLRHTYVWSSLDVATGTWSDPRDLPGSDDFYAQPKHWAATQRHLLFLREGPIDDGRRWTAYLVDPLAGSARRVDAPSPLPGAVAAQGALTAVGGRFVDVGAWVNDEGDLAWATHVLDPDAAGRPRWEEAAPPPMPSDLPEQHDLGLVGLGTSPLILGGLPAYRSTDGTWLGPPTAAAADPTVAAWGRVPEAPVDLHREGHAVVATDRGVVVWGGSADWLRTSAGPDDLLSDGAVYELAEDSP